MSRKIIQYHENIDKESSDKDKNRKLIITNYKGKDTALLIKNNRLISLYNIENESKIGNIYVGKVKNVVKNLNACFVEISNKEIAYLPFSEAKNPKLSPKQANSYIAEAHRRILAPFFNLVFALIACTGLLIANFNRRGQGKVITISILAMIFVQAMDMSFANMARKHQWIVFLMYLNCFLPLGITGWLLYKTPVFGKKRNKEIKNEA